LSRPFALMIGGMNDPSEGGLNADTVIVGRGVAG